VPDFFRLVSYVCYRWHALQSEAQPKLGRRCGHKSYIGLRMNRSGPPVSIMNPCLRKSAGWAGAKFRRRCCVTRFPSPAQRSDNQFEPTCSGRPDSVYQRAKAKLGRREGETGRSGFLSGLPTCLWLTRLLWLARCATQGADSITVCGNVQ
jgi:hypothetical protein